MRLNLDSAPADIYLKLENLQPIGSFKIRGAANRMLSMQPSELSRGVWTASAGNMAQGVAWCARRLGVPCSVVAPETAAETKLAAIRRLGANVVSVPFAEWLQCFELREHPQMDGLFIHAFDDPLVMAGNGTIGLEVVEDLPNADAIVIPYGGGGLTCGIASAIRALRPATKVYAVEVDTATPLRAALAAGKPVDTDYTPSWVDGIGAPTVFQDMFLLARRLVDGALTVELREVADAIRVLADRNHVIAEGAGAAPVAAALSGTAGTGNVVAVVSGGNIDPAKLATILLGKTP